MSEALPLEPLVSVHIVKVTPEGRVEEHDVVATEVPVTIMAAGVEVATLMCTPEHLDDLARGFLYTSGLLETPGAWLSCVVDKDRWTVDVDVSHPLDSTKMHRRTFTSGCGKGVVFANALDTATLVQLPLGLRVSATRVQELANWFRRHSELHHATGGVHTVALSVSGEDPVLVRDDVGRHNGLDKIVGRALARELDLAQSLLLTSGRISSEIVQKACRARIPMLLSLGAPTHQGVAQAKQCGMTLIGFARPSRFSIFSAPERVQ